MSTTYSGRAVSMLRSLSAVTDLTLKAPGRHASLEHLAYELDTSEAAAFAFAVAVRQRVVSAPRPWTTAVWMRAAEWIDAMGAEGLPDRPPPARRIPERLRMLLRPLLERQRREQPREGDAAENARVLAEEHAGVEL